MENKKYAHVGETLRNLAARFEKYLEQSSEERRRGVPDELFNAMEYSLTAGGKRLRPALCMSAAQRCGSTIDEALPLALGIEMFHTASLIHDDLPCMDDDKMRRGKPTNHVVFGETMAMLAGDALMIQALEYPLNYLKAKDPANILRSIRILAAALGPSGVCGGQALDINPTPENREEHIVKTAALKTGALIKASVAAGAALATSDDEVIARYETYGAHLGRAFQIVDDILDVTGTLQELGKTPGKDAGQDKITHVTIFGLENARKMARDESKKASAAILPLLSKGDFLVDLPEYLVFRTK